MDKFEPAAEYSDYWQLKVDVYRNENETIACEGFISVQDFAPFTKEVPVYFSSNGRPVVADIFEGHCSWLRESASLRIE